RLSLSAADDGEARQGQARADLVGGDDDDEGRSRGKGTSHSRRGQGQIEVDMNESTGGYSRGVDGWADVVECSRWRWSTVAVATHARLGCGVVTSTSSPVVVADLAVTRCGLL
ncbi:hypothetical protein Dimus_030393, partial [Dionaea muscipula]